MKEIIATLVDLDFRKKISMMECGSNKDKFCVKLIDEKGLMPFERHLISMLGIPKDKEMVLDDNLVLCSSDKFLRKMFLESFKEWKKLLKKQAGGMLSPLFPMFSYYPVIFGVILSYILYFISISLTSYPVDQFNYDLFIASIFSVGILFFYGLAFNSITKEGKSERDRWLILKRTIEDYTILEEKTHKEHIVWDRIIPYAVALGSTDKVYSAAKEMIDIPGIHEFKKMEKYLNPIEYSRVLFNLKWPV
jgi:hypothetical protein